MEISQAINGKKLRNLSQLSTEYIVHMLARSIILGEILDPLLVKL